MTVESPRRGLMAASLAPLLLAGAALTAGGCTALSDRVTMESTYIAGAYERKEFFYAAQNGEMEVLVLGAPADDPGFTARIVEAVGARLPGRGVHATTEPEAKPGGNHRIVMAFGAEGRIDGSRLCRRAHGLADGDPYRAAAAATGEGKPAGDGSAAADAAGSEEPPRRVHGAFCRGSTHLTAVRARLTDGAALAPDGPERIAAAATRQLFPFRNPNRDRNGNRAASFTASLLTH